MTFGEDDKEWLGLTIENAMMKAVEKHKEDAHKPLEREVRSIARMVWYGAGAAAAVSLLVNKLIP